ncbi:unnamed protein product [Echinostoma caproni]|uniref:Uncharacterized protein n=1 Tax=Echinostoma caproni TaxID=27848 RepID=A0A183ACC0_9TREM|nr:unnamed protein product [Echinostoma caproni]
MCIRLIPASCFSTRAQIPRRKEDSAVQTSIIAPGGEMGAWNGSHSLPSLCHSPLVTTTTSVNSPCANVPRPVKGDIGQTKQDLISFADWPNVTKLLAEQQATNNATARFTAFNNSDPQSTIPFTPETPVPNPATQITPTPTNSFMFHTEPPFVNPNPAFGSTAPGVSRPMTTFDTAWLPETKRKR